MSVRCVLTESWNTLFQARLGPWLRRGLSSRRRGAIWLDGKETVLDRACFTERRSIPALLLALRALTDDILAAADVELTSLGIQPLTFDIMMPHSPSSSCHLLEVPGAVQHILLLKSDCNLMAATGAASCGLKVCLLDRRDS